MLGSKNREIEVIAFDKIQAYKASKIFQDFKKSNTLVEFRDILISSCAISQNIYLATLNKKHFERIKDLSLI